MRKLSVLVSLGLNQKILMAFPPAHNSPSISPPMAVSVLLSLTHVILSPTGWWNEDRSCTLRGRDRLCQRRVVWSGAGWAPGQERWGGCWYKVLCVLSNPSQGDGGQMSFGPVKSSCVWLNTVGCEEELNFESFKLWNSFADSVETSSLEHFEAGSDNICEVTWVASGNERE